MSPCNPSLLHPPPPDSHDLLSDSMSLCFIEFYTIGILQHILFPPVWHLSLSIIILGLTHVAVCILNPLFFVAEFYCMVITPTFFGFMLVRDTCFYPLTLNLSVPLCLKWVLQAAYCFVESCLLIQIDNLCLLTWGFRPFTFLKNLFGCIRSQLWQTGFLVAACGLFSCGMRTLSCGMHAESSSLTRD